MTPAKTNKKTRAFEQFILAPPTVRHCPYSEPGVHPGMSADSGRARIAFPTALIPLIVDAMFR
jgi:hypothetical protein